MPDFLTNLSSRKSQAMTDASLLSSQRSRDLTFAVSGVNVLSSLVGSTDLFLNNLRAWAELQTTGRGGWAVMLVQEILAYNDLHSPEHLQFPISRSLGAIKDAPNTDDVRFSVCCTEALHGARAREVGGPQIGRITAPRVAHPEVEDTLLRPTDQVCERSSVHASIYGAVVH